MAKEAYVTIGEYALFTMRAGQGKPLVILEAGAGDDCTTWKNIFPAVAQFSQVMAYDRAGLGRSESAEMPRTASQLVHDLRCLLQVLQMEGPYLLVGHSLGALLCRLYAQQSQQEVAGLMLIDGPHPQQGERFIAALTATGWNEHELVQPILQMAAGVAPEQHPEGLDFAKSLAEVDQTRTFGDLPLMVISARKSPEKSWPDLPIQAAFAFTRTWDAMQKELLSLSTRGVHLTTTESGHYIHWDEPKLVVEAIYQMVKTIRNELS